jgi:hypothetical protein
MTINLDYIKAMRIQSWDAYFECLELIDNIKVHGSEVDKLRINYLRKRLSKLAENSRKYDSIYAIIHDPFYSVH